MDERSDYAATLMLCQLMHPVIMSYMIYVALLLFRDNAACLHASLLIPHQKQLLYMSVPMLLQLNLLYTANWHHSQEQSHPNLRAGLTAACDWCHVIQCRVKSVYNNHPNQREKWSLAPGCYLINSTVRSNPCWMLPLSGHHLPTWNS